MLGFLWSVSRSLQWLPNSQFLDSLFLGQVNRGQDDDKRSIKSNGASSSNFLSQKPHYITTRGLRDYFKLLQKQERDPRRLFQITSKTIDTQKDPWIRQITSQTGHHGQKQMEPSGNREFSRAASSRVTPEQAQRSHPPPDCLNKNTYTGSLTIVQIN